MNFGVEIFWLNTNIIRKKISNCVYKKQILPLLKLRNLGRNKERICSLF